MQICVGDVSSGELSHQPNDIRTYTHTARSTLIAPLYTPVADIRVEGVGYIRVLFTMTRYESNEHLVFIFLPTLFFL